MTSDRVDKLNRNRLGEFISGYAIIYVGNACVPVLLKYALIFLGWLSANISPCIVVVKNDFQLLARCWKCVDRSNLAK